MVVRQSSRSAFSQNVGVLAQTVIADPSLADLALEFGMAKRALEAEYEKNAELTASVFSSSFVSQERQADTGGCALSEPKESLWAHPPSGFVKPSHVSVLVGHKVLDHRARNEVETYLSKHNISATFWQATSAEEEQHLARTVPHKFLCILGDRPALRQTITGIMNRDDSTHVVLGILPSESLCMSTTEEMGIVTVQDGMDRVINGRFRAIDVFKVEDLSPEVCSRPTFGISHVDWGMTVAAVSSSQQMSKVLGSSAKTVAIYGGVVKNSSYAASIEIPSNEAPSGFVELLASEREYHGINIYNSKMAIMGTQHVLCSAEAKLDDGLMELTMKRFGSRADFVKNSKKVLLTSAFETTYAEDSWNSLVRVSSVIVRPATSGTAKCHSGPNSVIVDRDIVSGSPYKVSVVPRAINVFV